MKINKKIVSFGILSLLATLVVVFANSTVNAAHIHPATSTLTAPTLAQVVVSLNDTQVADAVITWERQGVVTCTGCDPIIETNSGTLVWDNVHNKYSSPGLLQLRALSENTNSCTEDAINSIIFSINGQENSGSLNLCSSWSQGIAETQLTLPDQQQNGAVNIIISDKTGILNDIQMFRLDCTLTGTNVSINCADIFSTQLNVRGNDIIITDLDPNGNPYTFTVSYQEQCPASGSCDVRDLINFTAESITFNITAGETVYVTLEVEALKEYGEIDGNVPEVSEKGDLPCDARESHNSIEWLVCPVVNLLFRAVDFVYSNMIIPLLPISPLSDSSAADSPEAALFNIWNSVRIIANILFIIVFLLAIFGQSLSGFEKFSAYEVRKIIPRLVIGVIAIQLSWYFIGFMVDIFNVLGSGIRSLILAPVEGLTSISFDLENVWTEIAGSLGIIAGATTVVLAGGILMGLPLVLFPIVLGLVAAFVTVLLRRVLVMMLIITAPLAFVAWILPNTEGVFRKWWEYFWKSLFVYPMIIALIASGELMAKIVTASNISTPGSQESIMVSVIAIIAFFTPYFLIPFTFRLAGGALAEVANGLDKKGKSLNQRAFGEERDPKSWRSRRKAQMTNVRQRRKRRYMKMTSNLQENGRSTAIKRLGGAANKMGAIIGQGTMDKSAIQLAEARDRVVEMTGSARDEEVYAILGDKQIINGRDLSKEAIHNSTLNRGDHFMMQAALEYALGKAGDNEELQTIYKNFMNNDEYASKIKDYEKEKMFGLSTDYMQQYMGDFKYRDPRTLAMTKDLKKLGRFSTEIIHRKGGFRDTSKQRASFWEGIDDMSSQARKIYEEAGGNENFDADRLTTDERNLLSNMRVVREGFRNTPSTGSEPSANQARRKTVTNLDWLDHNNLDSL